ncbi:hypothetical protein AJ85_08360 [Alkalihalobacillus alcalophilus ATCC 27647 = CGMCC 1.3604]|uniref:Uncharacterized protein n=1 Tax=Alkalihalobacillus alcalophilus ATCC 27647 = CGMCC 1.3604 TaxID=1218173 RepID=A0A094YUL7_ALKAL|nr:hypothetical protein [Alkalihalobacillus alcalophilus]KGA97192.1 hypothetical protein BALCAV_0211800 [Alkalihalobacillus alcalophilus ATCC 27647 = CGMCC 1.3604]MED1560876.1 hypothetical protein [Alkalihalobacillus alcalophilus]THG90866.1 hypothetical protein AJ85_08360 [Alkalihalobacillus alcalophilus ATCC 27647 = CGMCC 1.3604]
MNEKELKRRGWFKDERNFEQSFFRRHSQKEEPTLQTLAQKVKTKRQVYQQQNPETIFQKLLDIHKIS